MGSMPWHSRRGRDALTGVATPDVSAVVAGTVSEVVDYVEAHPDEASAVLAAEQAGKGRKGVIAAATAVLDARLSAVLDDDE